MEMVSEEQDWTMEQPATTVARRRQGDGGAVVARPSALVVCVRASRRDYYALHPKTRIYA